MQPEISDLVNQTLQQAKPKRLVNLDLLVRFVAVALAHADQKQVVEVIKFMAVNEICSMDELSYAFCC
jgi:hypothetical protein